MQLAQDKARKRKRLLIAIVSALAVLVVSLSLLVTKVIIPGNRYKEAEALLAAGAVSGSLGGVRRLRIIRIA